MAFTEEQREKVRAKEKKRKADLKKERAKTKEVQVGRKVREWLITNGWEKKDQYVLTKGNPAEYRAIIRERKVTLEHKVKFDDGRKRWMVSKIIPFHKIDGMALSEMTSRGKVQPTGELLLKFLESVVLEKDEEINKYYFGLKLLDLAEKLGYKVDEILIKAVLSRDQELILKLLNGE